MEPPSFISPFLPISPTRLCVSATKHKRAGQRPSRSGRVKLQAAIKPTSANTTTWWVLLPKLPVDVTKEWSQVWKRYETLSAANPESVISRSELIILLLCFFLDRPVMKGIHTLLSTTTRSWNALVDRTRENRKQNTWIGLPKLYEPRPYSQSTIHAMEGALRLLAVMYFSVSGLAAFAIFLRALKVTLPKDITKRIERIGFILYGTVLARKLVIFVLFQSLKNLKWIKTQAKIFSLERLLEIIIYAIGFFGIITWIGVPLSSVLAFGGIGGIAFGLATKEIAQNLVGGVMLSFIAPFGPGDFIKSKDGDIEGIVEDVGWYMTRMRGLDYQPTYIPNAIFVNKQVTNISKITHRRFLQSFGVRYCDFPKVDGIVDELRKTLKNIPAVDVGRGFRVFFVGFGSYSLNIEVLLAFREPDYAGFLELQAIALREIARVVLSRGAEFAFPTTAIQIDQSLADSFVAQQRIDADITPKGPPPKSV